MVSRQVVTLYSFQKCCGPTSRPRWHAVHAK